MGELVVNCFYCNQKGHKGDTCNERWLEEKVGSIQKILDEISYSPVSDLIDPSGMEKHKLWGHSLFAQYLLFPAYLELLQKEINENDLTIPTTNSRIMDFYNRGKDFFERNLVTEALFLIRNSVELDKKYFQAKILYAYCLIEQGSLEKAQSLLEDAVFLSPSNKISSYLCIIRARIFQCLGNLEETKKLVKVSLDLDPSFFLPVYYLCVLYSTGENIENSLFRQLERKNTNAFMGLLLDRETECIRSQIISIIEGDFKVREKKIQEMLPAAQQALGKAKEIQGDMFASFNFKAASIKIARVEDSSLGLSFQGTKSILRDLEDAFLYIDTVKSLTNTRKALTEKALKSFKKNTIKTGISSGLLVSGWAFVLGGVIGVVKHVLTPNSSQASIIFWCLGMSLLAFVILQINCQILLASFRKNFMEKYIKSFHSQEVWKQIKKEVYFHGDKKSTKW